VASEEPVSLHRHRELARALAWRELVVRYKRSIIGVGWAFADPVLNTLVYVLVFGTFLDAGRQMAGYGVFVLVGVVVWTFVSMTIEQASGVLQEHAVLIRRVPFPHELLVFAVVVSRSMTLVISIVGALLFAAAGFGGARLDVALLPTLFGGIFLLVGGATGAACICAAVAVFFADTAYLLRISMRLAFYACPIVYPLTRVPAEWRDIYGLNPMTGLLWMVGRPMVTDLAYPGGAALVAAVVAPVVLCVVGIRVMRLLRYRYVELL
jgi:ABC-type polysaccharide/polyol phosphate export permease